MSAKQSGFGSGGPKSHSKTGCASLLLGSKRKKLRAEIRDAGQCQRRFAGAVQNCASTLTLNRPIHCEYRPPPSARAVGNEGSASSLLPVLSRLKNWMCVYEPATKTAGIT